MAKSDFGPEIKSSMEDAPPRTGNPIKERPNAGAQARVPQAGPVPRPPRMPPNAAPPRIVQNAPPDAHHIAAAAGIAHAILGNRALGGMGANTGGPGDM